MRLFPLNIVILCTFSLFLAHAEGPRYSAVSSVLVVELPVRVLVKGRPVAGLEAGDFEIFDRGQERQIVGFEVLDNRPAAEKAGVGAEARGEPGTLSSRLILFDFAYADGLSLTKALVATRTHLRNQARSDDAIALGFFSALRGLRLVAPPTTEPLQIAAALDLLEALLAHDSDEVDRLSALRTLSYDTNVATPEELRAEAKVMIRADPYWPHRSVIRRFSRDLSRLALAYSALPGHRTILLFSHGFETKYLIGRGSAGTLGELEQAFKACRTAGWAINAVNAGGLRALGGRESLFLLAHETGGEAFENFNDLNEALDLLARHASITYILAFQVDDPEPGAGFRRLRVELRDKPGGVRLIHRPGYYSPPAGKPQSLDTLR